jgi:hypothetical protein
MVSACAILADIILKEKLHQLGILGCVICIARSVIILKDYMMHFGWMFFYLSMSNLLFLIPPLYFTI